MELEILSHSPDCSGKLTSTYAGWTDSIRIRQQQCDGTMAYHPSERHVDTGEKHPQLYHAFQRGAFVVNKSSHDFSAIVIDQAHEQANAVIKADGGAIGVTEDPSALSRWIIAGPEVSQLVALYEIASEAKETVVHTNHHEHTPKLQQVFLERVENLFQLFTDMGNPFNEKSRDVLSLHTNDIAHASAAELIFTHHDRGRKTFRGIHGWTGKRSVHILRTNQETPS